MRKPSEGEKLAAALAASMAVGGGVVDRLTSVDEPVHKEKSAHVKVEKNIPKQDVPHGLIVSDESKPDVENTPPERSVEVVVPDVKNTVIEVAPADSEEQTPVDDKEVIFKTAQEVEKLLNQIQDVTVFDYYVSHLGTTSMKCGIQDENERKEIARIDVNYATQNDYVAQLTVRAPTREVVRPFLVTLDPHQAKEFVQRVVPLWREYKGKFAEATKRANIDIRKRQMSGMEESAVYEEKTGEVLTDWKRELDGFVKEIKGE